MRRVIILYTYIKRWYIEVIEQLNWRFKLDGLFVEDEAYEVVKALNRDNALGLDGYSLAFFKHVELV